MHLGVKNRIKMMMGVFLKCFPRGCLLLPDLSHSTIQQIGFVTFSYELQQKYLHRFLFRFLSFSGKNSVGN